MKKLLLLLGLAIGFLSCQNNAAKSSVDPVNWGEREVRSSLPDSLVSGSTYLSVYSQIYSETEQKIHNITVTVSIRNTSRKDAVYIENADYFDTEGNLIRSYFDTTISIAPMETVEIVIDELDKEGGTGANFLFDWKMYPDSNEPLFEAVMISTYGQQGLSFTTQGKRIR